MENFEIKTSITEKSGLFDLKALKAKIIARGGSISIGIEGYDDYYSENSCGTPIYLELYEGKLVLRVWADINSQDPTHVIDLEQAKESNRKNP